MDSFGPSANCFQKVCLYVVKDTKEVMVPAFHKLILYTDLDVSMQ